MTSPEPIPGAVVDDRDTIDLRDEPAVEPDTTPRRSRRSRRGWWAAIDPWMLVLLLCAPLLGAVGVVAAELVPDTAIADHLVDAMDDDLVGPFEPGPTPLGTTAARYTECTSFSLGLGDRPGEHLVADAMISPAYTGCDRFGSALREYELTGELRPGFSYLRYWHGYALLTRPALAVFGVGATRWLAFTVLAVAVFAMASAVRRAAGSVTAGVLVLPALLTTDLVIASLSASTAIGTTTAWLGGWLALRGVARRPHWATAALVAALAGALSAYFDLMTTMPGALALTAVGATVGAVAAQTPGESAPTSRPWVVTAAAIGGWLAGLAWMWGGKWVVAAAVLGVDEVVDTVGSQIGFRLSSGTHGVSDARTEGLTENVAQWWAQPLTPWVIGATALALVIAGLRWRRRRAPRWTLLPCAALVVLPVVGWYLALNNHSQIHDELVYRSLPFAFAGVAALVCIAVGGAPLAANRDER